MLVTRPPSYRAPNPVPAPCLYIPDLFRFRVQRSWPASPPFQNPWRRANGKRGGRLTPVPLPAPRTRSNPAHDTRKSGSSDQRPEQTRRSRPPGSGGALGVGRLAKKLFVGRPNLYKPRRKRNPTSPPRVPGLLSGTRCFGRLDSPAPVSTCPDGPFSVHLSPLLQFMKQRCSGPRRMLILQDPPRGRENEKTKEKSGPLNPRH